MYTCGSTLYVPYVDQSGWKNAVFPWQKKRLVRKWVAYKMIAMLSKLCVYVLSGLSYTVIFVHDFFVSCHIFFVVAETSSAQIKWAGNQLQQSLLLIYTLCFVCFCYVYCVDCLKDLKICKYKLKKKKVH